MTSNSDLVKRLRVMGRHTCGIGQYWSAIDEATDALEAAEMRVENVHALMVSAEAKLAKAREALRPLAAHAGILEMGFSAEELAAMDHEHHLIAHGITIGDSFRARSVLKEIDDAT